MRESDHQAIAAQLALLVTKAMAPVLERLAVAETKAALVAGLQQEIATLRERLTVTETKAAQPFPVVPDLMPLTERMSAVEVRLDPLVDLRDRVVAVETKTAQPVTQPVTLETKSDESLVDLRARLTALEGKAQSDTSSLEVAALRERLAVLETRAPVPGPPGRDGVDGKDGADGLGFDDFEEIYDGERTVTHRYKQGDRVKEFTLSTPTEIYRGVWVEGKTYERWDGVTWGGSEWHCNETTTTKPGEGSKAWTLKVKRGRDGRDGRDAVTVPVVSVGSGR